jgi:hypothetical protein
MNTGRSGCANHRSYGIALYSRVRWDTLDRADAPSVDDIVVGTLGTRVKF